LFLNCYACLLYKSLAMWLMLTVRQGYILTLYVLF